MKGKKVGYSTILIKWFGVLFIILMAAITLFSSGQSYRILLKKTITSKINEITIIYSILMKAAMRILHPKA